MQINFKLYCLTAMWYFCDDAMECMVGFRGHGPKTPEVALYPVN